MIPLSKNNKKIENLEQKIKDLESKITKMDIYKLFIETGKNITDMNDELYPGIYAYGPNTLNSPYKEGKNGEYGFFITIINHSDIIYTSSLWVYQFAFSGNSIYYRCKIATGSWRQWFEINKN